MEVRLQKIIAAAGIASRRAAEKLIAEGRVQVNGTTVTELGTKADPEVDDIRVDERRVKQAQRHRYFLLNKPRGYVTTRSGERLVFYVASNHHESSSDAVGAIDALVNALAAQK